jgi:hypothetical protein
VEISEIEAARLDAGKLAEITSPSLFSSRRAAVVNDLETLAPELDAELVNLAAAQISDLAVIGVHSGGPKGKGLLEKLKSVGAEVIECPAVKTWELPQFVSAEAKRAGSSIDAGAASALVDAVGHDLRSCHSTRLGWRGRFHQRRSGASLLRWSGRGNQFCGGRCRPGGAYWRCNGAAPLGVGDRRSPSIDH